MISNCMKHVRGTRGDRDYSTGWLERSIRISRRPMTEKQVRSKRKVKRCLHQKKEDDTAFLKTCPCLARFLKYTFSFMSRTTELKKLIIHSTQYAAQDVVILFKLKAAIYIASSHTARVLKESNARVRSISSPSYVPNGRHKCLAPTNW